MLFVVFCTAVPCTAQHPLKQQVLLLHSYHRGLRWTDTISDGVESVLGKDQDIDLQIVHMDTKRVATPEYFHQLERYYLHRFAGADFDVVICSDDNAFDFMLARRQRLFPETPLVFCGVNYFEPEEIEGQEDITGVVETLDVADTIALARQLHPDMRHLYIINDRTTTGEANRKVIERALDRDPGAFDAIYLSDLTIAELQAALRELPDDSVMLLMSFNRDRSGRVFSYRESSALIAEACKAPIYGVWDFYLGRGIVGGKLVSGFRQGVMAARLVQRILAGADADDIPVVTHSLNGYRFDYRQLKRHGLEKAVLPPGSEVINKPPPFVKVDKRVFWVVVGLVTGLAFVVMVLLIERYERRRAEELIRREHAIFTGGPVVLFRWVNDKGWPVEYVSANISQYGYSAEDFMQRRILYEDIVHPDDKQRVAEEVQDYTSSGQRSFEQRYRVICADGRERWIYDITRISRDSRGRVTHYDGYVLDITEQRNWEEKERQLHRRLARAEKLESLGKLAGGVAHDLNNILGPLVGYPELILKELPPNSPVTDCVQGIRSSAQRAATVIQDLLALARRGTFEVRPVDINEVVGSYLSSTSFRMLQEHHPDVDIVTELEDEEVIVVEGSASHLSRVVMNLVINGIEAMDAGGTLTISTAIEHVTKPVGLYHSAAAGRYAVIRVADTGCGMQQDDVERIFDPFFTKRKSGRSGTGLGLAVVYGVIRDHHGAIDVKTKVGAGSTFTVYLPATETSAGVEREEPVPTGGTESILIVDDREEQRRLTAEMLQSLGYTVRQAGSGREAVKKMRKNTYDLIMLDMIMEEDFDGLDTYRAIRSIRPRQKCIIISGYAQTERVEEALDMGAGAFLRKPYTLVQLDRAVRGILDGKADPAATSFRRVDA
jgi:PAS domain S-box-containing protein